jgi:hypothetical protein
LQQGPEYSAGGRSPDSKECPASGCECPRHVPGNSATGVSDKDGKFSLTYLGRNGAVPGTDLKVGVTKTESGLGAVELPGSGPPKTDEEAKAYGAKMQEMMQKRQKDQEQQMKKGEGAKNLVDQKYGRPDSSGLKVTIPASGSKELKIDVPS